MLPARQLHARLMKLPVCVWGAAAVTEEQADAAAASSGARTPTAIILEPSRDLAAQTHDNIVNMARCVGSSIAALQKPCCCLDSPHLLAARDLSRIDSML